jgi:hypothetical protein
LGPILFVQDTKGSPYRLNLGECLASPNGKTQFILQSSGNIVVYIASTTMWSSNTGNWSASYLEISSYWTGSSLSLYSTTNKTSCPDQEGGDCRAKEWGPSWTPLMLATPQLKVQDDANVVVYQGTKALWSTGTNR